MSIREEQFVDRHIGPNQEVISEMLNFLGEKDSNEFLAKVVPAGIAQKLSGAESLSAQLPTAISERAALHELEAIAKKNKVYRSYIGMGYYGTITPPVVLRNVLENPAWYTAYTPYQPEISQGRLEALFAFQTVVTDLTGLDVSNASMLDEATAGAEAMTIARRRWSGEEEAVLVVDSQLHPQTIAVIANRAKPLGIKISLVEVTSENLVNLNEKYFGVIYSQWGTRGRVHDLKEQTKIAAIVEANGATLAVATDLLGLTLFDDPGKWGAHIAFGSAQRFGVPMGFGGPHAGFLAVKQGLERTMPGRLVGLSKDNHGAPAYRLALQTREQHIRRDKATSNICTAQVLLAVIAGFYAIWHGPEGLRRIATDIHSSAQVLANLLRDNGFTIENNKFFDTISIVDLSHEMSEKIRRAALEKEINLRYFDGGVSISLDETISSSDLLDLVHVFGSIKSELLALTISEIDAKHDLFFTENSKSTDFCAHDYLLNPIFSQHYSETRMLRYLRSLSDRDLALDRTMIPLGSCTMKLNSTTEMIPVTWKEFACLHPFVPADQSVGYREMIDQLSAWLVSITGYDAVSLQPNAGSQGEFAGLLAIRNYLDSRGETGRAICLIPSSAHGTNAASAVMAGMKVVVVACDDAGNVSLDDLKEKIAAHKNELAALMVTYPSTHGVFEEEIAQICASIHEAGGQVYVDGANLNALVGLAQPGKFGADVSHLNLHKTFCIPHGGGGPGVGPVIARAHLAPFLPNHPLDENAGPSTSSGPISAAPFGSASILPISWMYIRTMGGEGLTRATTAAIVNANYMAKRLDSDFPVLYKGKNGYVAHECIIDVRDITKETGVTVDDIAKRLMDFGFHAPTMSFPVAGTLMIEPTESEDLTEIDRFISALKVIREEIRAIEVGTISAEDSPLHFAPHTQEDLLQEKWDRKYPIAIGAFPAGLTARNEHLHDDSLGKRSKYWPFVGRIDGAYGDRNLICSCPSPEEFA